MRGPLGDHLAGDRTAATGAELDFACFVIGFEMFIVLAQFALQAALAAKRRAAELNPFREDFNDGFV